MSNTTQFTGAKAVNQNSGNIKTTDLFRPHLASRRLQRRSRRDQRAA